MQHLAVASFQMTRTKHLCGAEWLDCSSVYTGVQHRLQVPVRHRGGHEEKLNEIHFPGGKLPKWLPGTERDSHAQFEYIRCPSSLIASVH